MNSSRHDLLFNAHLSAMYHRRRAAFLDMVSKAMSAIVLLSGTATFAAITADEPLIGKLAGALTTLIGILQVVASPDAAAADHRHWHSAWKELEGEILSKGRLSSQEKADWIRRRREIECSYVSELRALQRDCYNKTIMALGLDAKERLPLGRRHRLLCQVVRFESLEPNTDEHAL